MEVQLQRLWTRSREALPREGEAPADARAAARAAFDPSDETQAADVMLFAQLYLA